MYFPFLSLIFPTLVLIKSLFRIKSMSGISDNIYFRIISVFFLLFTASKWITTINWEKMNVIKRIVRFSKRYLKRIYRISIKRQKYQELVWKQLKSEMTSNNFRCGTFEQQKYCQVIFQIAENKAENYIYSVTEDNLVSQVIIIDQYPTDLTIIIPPKYRTTD